MPKIKDLSSKFKVPLAERELEILLGRQEAGQRSDGSSPFSNIFNRGRGESVFSIIGSGIVVRTMESGRSKGGFDNIQKAIEYCNAAGGGQVKLPVGTFVISEDIILYSNIDLIGGANNLTILDFNGGEKMIIINDKTNIGISRIHLTGYRYLSRSVSYSPSGVIHLTHTNASGLLTDDIIIRDCKFTDNYNSSTWVADPHYSISASYANRVKIKDCIFDNTVGIGAYGNKMIIKDNDFLDIKKNVIYLNSMGGEISSNLFDGCEDEVVKSADDIENFVIANNKILNHIGAGFLFTGGFDYCIINGNTAEGDAGSTDFINLGSQASNSVISNNCAVGFGGDGIDINGADKCIISGNMLVSNGAWGIDIKAGSVNNLVHGNICDSNSSGGVQDNGTTTTVADNKTI